MPATTSFRDPAGFSVAVDGRFLRVIAPGHVAHIEAFLNSDCARTFAADAALVGTRLLGKPDVAQLLEQREFSEAIGGRAVGAVFEHERISFPSFPCEWSPAMLYAAAELTLDLAVSALKSGYNLKDATPANILFRGTKPVFVDLLSFEPRVAGETIWKPYAQFVRTFLLPLLSNKSWGTSPAEIFITHRDGLEPQELYRKCTLFQKIRPPFLGLITLPTLLGKQSGSASVRASGDDEKALFILESLFKRLRSTLSSLKPTSARHAGWAGYMVTHSYDAQGFAAKETFVRDAFREFKPAKVLDVGANTGHFSRIAATAGAEVIAIDTDPSCASEGFMRARDEKSNVLSLVVDIARPTPALGWRNGESASFLDRARGHFDAVLMLALVHHLQVTERVPLCEIFDLAAQLTKSLLLIEFVPLDDPMFQRLLRGRDALFAGYNRQVFEEACQRRFDIVRYAEVPGSGRRLYLLKKK
ncbi:MAG TPA: class I SAM-dependent methyltransferase [Verrucomicrobiae bacterium]|nr:class I SAM-dependent methyltransferase [Verrucomicrobiae bacterium]